MLLDSAVEFVNLTTGPGGSTVSIGSLSVPAAITVNGNNTGSDQVSVEMNGSNAAVAFSGGTGTGDDLLFMTDNVIGPVTYTIDSTTVSRSGRSVSYSSLEFISLTGAPNTANTFNVSGGAALTGFSLIGGSASDAFNLTAAQFGYMTVAGAGGSLDTLVVDDRTQSTNMLRANLSVDYMDRYYGPDLNTLQIQGLDYSSIEAWTYFGKNSTTEINVYGTPSSIPAGLQATIICGTGADTVTLYPHDVNGNLTINGNLGVGGGSGSDKVIVDDTGATNGISYEFLNTFGPGSQKINGLGTGGFGAANDV
jgi:hypothetical protein